ncbi:hypothetical protein Q5P01_003789 [Channa striata]|uniref:Uncharacterized protein n=1 Tax=Channa striata TaxID=64152 RepID=A0AA88T1N3_CHASR|nr:hypothetical protein Q5P01_003789 [Channa striata]
MNPAGNRTETREVVAVMVSIFTSTLAQLATNKQNVDVFKEELDIPQFCDGARLIDKHPNRGVDHQLMIKGKR